MPIQRLAPPTLEQVERELGEYQATFNLTSDEFERDPSSVTCADEDAAMEWFFLIEQRRALQQLQAPRQYWRTGFSGRTVRDERRVRRDDRRQHERRSYHASVAA